MDGSARPGVTAIRGAKDTQVTSRLLKGPRGGDQADDDALQPHVARGAEHDGTVSALDVLAQADRRLSPLTRSGH